MSADNGIYILKTKAVVALADSYYEYRVAHAQGIENIYWDVEKGAEREDDQFTPEIAFDYFGKASVFRYIAEAQTYAHDLADTRHWFLEYGICSLNHGNQVFQTFSAEEMESFDARSEEIVSQHHEEREAKRQTMLKATTIPFVEGMAFEPGTIHGYLVKEDGTKVHGSLSGIKQLMTRTERIGPSAYAVHLDYVTGQGEGFTFLPSDWHKAPKEFPCGHPRLPGEDICSGLHCNDDLKF